MEGERAQYLELKQLLEEKEKALQHVTEEGEFLEKQYKHTKKEVGVAIWRGGVVSWECVGVCELVAVGKQVSCGVVWSVKSSSAK